MKEVIEVTGVILLAQPIGEFDKRLVILTRELGKITAFARGVRRPKSPALAVCNPFVFAKFQVYEGRDAYTFGSAEVVEYFTELSAMQPEVWYGFYFLELASYYTKEGMEAEAIVNLIFLALRAMQRQRMPLALIRRVFELRLMAESGDFAMPQESGHFSKDAYRAIWFCASCKLVQLFAFSIEENVQKELSEEVKRQLRRNVDRPMKSVMMLNEGI